jgi:hypothetical protein
VVGNILFAVEDLTTVSIVIACVVFGGILTFHAITDQQIGTRNLYVSLTGMEGKLIPVGGCDGYGRGLI